MSHTLEQDKHDPKVKHMTIPPIPNCPECKKRYTCKLFLASPKDRECQKVEK